MPHVLVVGTTASGKTTLAKRLATEYRRHGFEVLVLDPIGDRGWPTAYVYTEPEAFLETAEQSERCVLILDESAETVGHYNEPMKRCATRFRHLGHRSFFITQRPAQLSPTVRDQCLHLYAFRVAPDDAKCLARDWTAPELEEMLPRLPQGTCIKAGRYGSAQELVVFRPRRQGPTPRKPEPEKGESVGPDRHGS